VRLLIFQAVLLTIVRRVFGLDRADLKAQRRLITGSEKGAAGEKGTDGAGCAQRCPLRAGLGEAHSLADSLGKQQVPKPEKREVPMPVTVIDRANRRVPNPPA
jgi:hypothetical protein